MHTFKYQDSCQKHNSLPFQVRNHVSGNNLLQKNCVAVWHTGMCQATILHTKNCYTNILLCSICPKLRSKLHRYTRQIIPCVCDMCPEVTLQDDMHATDVGYQWLSWL